MEASTSSRGRIRRLAGLRPETGRVLSLYLDLDPASFATGADRATQITSLLDEAGKAVEAMKDDLDRDALLGLREDVERAGDLFDPQSMGQGGVRGIAVFLCGPSDVTEIVRTPYPLDQGFFIGETPYIEPLATSAETERWCVVLVSRRDGRIFFGDRHGFQEFENVFDDTKGQHQQGGWSQRRYEESIENEKRDHLDRVGDRLLGLLKRRPFDRLLIGGSAPVDTEFKERLHPYLSEKVTGTIDVDVETANAADVLEAAAPVFEEHRRNHERDAIERLRAGLGRGEDGLAVAGLDATLDALNQQRVEVLLLEPGVSRRGWWDPTTGFIAAEAGASPTGGTLDELDDVIEAATEKAVEQSAEILVLRDNADLGAHGGVAALLRF
jgi:peptide subunit release factor 1 (eRF1)